MKPNPKYVNYNHPKQDLQNTIRQRAAKYSALILERKEEILQAINVWALTTKSDWAKGWEWKVTLFNNIKIDGKPLALTYLGLSVYYGDMSPSDQEEVLIEGSDLELINEEAFRKLPGYMQNTRTRYRIKNRKKQVA